MATIASSGPTPASHGRNSGGSTAPVLEFVCLFTHDLRRKQKRWQDGRVKYHLFNKRVMVYDDRGNVVGDMYWRRDWEFDEGEEVETERGGVIVQVAECVGRQNQDLSELLDKRVKEKEQRAAARPAVPPVPMHTSLSISRTPMQRDHLQARHRPLNKLLGTPTGHHGRAVVPTESPYEQRHTPGQTPDGQSNHQPSKKRRYDDSPPSKKGYAQSLFGTQLTLSGGPTSSAPIRRPAVSRSQPRVDISSSAEDGSEDTKPADAMDESNYRSNKRPDMQDLRRNAGGTEQASLAQGNISTPSKVSIHTEPTTPSADADTERRDVQQTGYTSNKRGVSSHFSHASNESQRQASLLRSMGMKTGPSSNIGTAMAEKESRKLNDAETRQRACRSPEPGPGPEPELEQAIVLDEVDDVGQGMAKLPDRHENVARTKRDPPEPQNQPNAKRRKDAGQLVPPLVARTDSEAENPTARGPGAATVPEAPKEPRTELRLKSRQKRGLLVVSEMAKKAKAKIVKEKGKRTSVRPGPEKPIRNSEERQELQQGDADEQLDEETPEIPARQRPVSPDPEDGDPFASLPNFPQVVPSKHVPQSVRSQGAKKKYATERNVAEDDDDLFAARSPEPTNRSKVVGKKPRSSEMVYDISDDTDHEDEALQIERTEKPALKRPQKKLSRGKTTTKAQNPEEIGPEAEQSPPTRNTRARRRKVDKSPRQEKPEKASWGRSNKNKKRQLSKSGSSEESAQEDLPKGPARPRVVKMSRKSVKSREVFGFAPSSSPPPPTFGPGSPPAPARPIPGGANDAIPTLNIEEDIVVKAGSVPTVAKPEATPTNPGGSIPSVSPLQPHNSLPHTDEGGIEDAAVTLGVTARIVQPSDGAIRRVPSTTQVVGRTTSSLNRLMSPTASGLQTVEAQNETAADAQNKVGQDEQPVVVCTEESRSLHVESHKTASSPHRRPTAIAHPEQSLSGTDGPIRPRPVPVPMTVPVATEVHPVLPKIMNPASRGRKAALKSDAAGRTPQSILPPVEPVAARSNLVARAAVCPGAVTAGVEERPKLKMTFPGFVSAREGGPWSREAHDLFEPGRPP